MPLFPVVSYEKNSGKPKLVLIGGFPDNETSSWGKVVPEKLSQDYDLYFLCLPGYEKGGNIPLWGYNFHQLIEFLDVTLDQKVSQDRYTLVCHDWGAFIGLLYQTKFPDKVKKLVLLDVGMVTPFTASLKSLLYVSMYQIWFVISFLASRVIGAYLGTIFMGIFYLPIFKPLWPSYDRPPVPRREISVNKCYPYLYLWKDLLSLKFPNITFPICPTLYMFGNQKNCMFHDDEFINTLKNRKDCDVREVNAGHWLQISKAEDVAFEIQKFLALK